MPRSVLTSKVTFLPESSAVNCFVVLFLVLDGGLAVSVSVLNVYVRITYNIWKLMLSESRSSIYIDREPPMYVRASFARCSLTRLVSR